jgi:hypothetical protein
VALVPTRSAEKDFEELLSLLWAARFEELRPRRDSGELQADSDSQETNGKAGDAR